MSADNGIYIARFPDGYRVCYGHAIENLDYYPEGTKERKKELESYFGESRVYDDEDLAFMAAKDLSKEVGWTEYGICFIGEYEEFIR